MSIIRIIGSTLFFVGVFAIALLLAFFVSRHEHIADTVADLGYPGVVIAAYISGLDLIVPIPAATLSPIFTSAGLSLTWVIALIIIGTLLADITAYYLGVYSKRFTVGDGIMWYERVKRTVENKKQLVLPLLFVYAAVVPIPNEVLVIPLAALGYRLSTIIVPLALGTALNVSVVSLGSESAFVFLKSLF